MRHRKHAELKRLLHSNPFISVQETSDALWWGILHGDLYGTRILLQAGVDPNGVCPPAAAVGVPLGFFAQHATPLDLAIELGKAHHGDYWTIAKVLKEVSRERRAVGSCQGDHEPWIHLSGVLSGSVQRFF